MNIQPFDFGPRFDTIVAPPSLDALLERVGALETELDAQATAHATELTEAREAALDRGRDEGRAEVSAALRAALDALRHQLETIEHRIDERVADLTRDAAELALAAADLLAGEVAVTWPLAAVTTAVERVLRDTERATALAIRVNPSLAPALDLWLAERPRALTRGIHVEIVPDDEVTPGDGMVDWRRGGLAIDAAARRAALSAELAPALATIAPTARDDRAAADPAKEDDARDPALG
ncbi:flagellar assembly protein H [Sphingomonas sp. RHCKR7]|uniref:FliH/SctL family protein n=1 Tax=Sphingomonas folli TaxID=2862497 RepID=UPI001CA4BE5C|nr:FliH/SctL family protein [Sphingomonas folli]MBW6525531.1 flagellar assembly protein H [Sphingomonas folli]